MSIISKITLIIKRAKTNGERVNVCSVKSHSVTTHPGNDKTATGI